MIEKLPKVGFSAVLFQKYDADFYDCGLFLNLLLGHCLNSDQVLKKIVIFEKFNLKKYGQSVLTRF